MLILFGGENYYAKGGANDFICVNSDIAHLVRLAKKLCIGNYLHYSEIDWWHVFDTAENKIVAQSAWQAHVHVHD